MAKELPSYKPSNHTIAAPLTSLLYDPLRTAKGPITTEECYAQIEKECLAIVEALNTFEELLSVKSNRVYTDHQPFQSIFKKDLASASKCLQKMLLFLQRYNFTIVYRKGSLLNLADNLSRTPCQDEAVNTSMSDTFLVFHVHLARLDLTHWPSPIPLSSNYAMPHHHALTCTCCSITPSTVGHLLRSSYPINSKHPGTFVKNSAL